MTELKKILVPIDFAADARPVVEYAIGIAKKFGAALELLHVWQPPAMLPAQLFVVPEPGSAPMPAEEVARSVASAQLKEFAAQAKQAGVTTHCHVGVGDPAHDIVDLSASGNYDLIIMGTHGRTGLTHALLGSVAEKVVRRAKCPVLTVRARG